MFRSSTHAVPISETYAVRKTTTNRSTRANVAILEFWHCLKSPERETMVTRSFTSEEYERMSCRKCTSTPN
ncbi:hypothetical protein ARALYDRAFT_893884 [Arabidopsis lyrata subsp. lyrata]|uniref:Uncharacterized protein n=1 Tax=Arabidopsis lyrata subsp. lyrata TaxID=81972 RepID=D7KQV3_ARALL|nr:hypothetical protein ARALYDRAFT_893884 [Arabidopsis lyrata subsp. lyrata]